MTEPPQSYSRTAGDDTIISVRVRRANLPTLEQGLTLGVDVLTLQPIVLQLCARDDGIHDLMVVTSPIPMAETPDPVDPEIA